jgi:hypothetical protein
MSSRIIVTGKNRDFSVFGMPATPGGARGRAEGSSAPSRQELPAHSGVQPASGPLAELMGTQTADTYTPPTTTPEAAPAVSGTRLAVCPDCMGAGYDFDFYNCPLEHITKKQKVTCGYCHGECAIEVPL